MNDGSPECVRCGCDLEILVAIIQTAQSETCQGKEKLRMGKPDEALKHALQSWRLKKSVDAAKIAFLANIEKKRFEDALPWYQKIGQMEPSNRTKKILAT